MEQIAFYGLFILLSIFLVFHVLVVTKVIPYQVVWGGRLKTDRDMYRFESFSLLVNSFFVFCFTAHEGWLAFPLSSTFFTILFWTMTILFLLNTVGNILSKNKLEQRFFTPITLLMAVFSLILAIANS